jgi:hypothetical protein
MPKEFVAYVVPILIVGLVLWRASRAMKGRSVTLSRLWIRPTIIAVLMAVAFATSPLPDGIALAIFLAAAAVGLGVGYLLASHQTLAIDPASGRITSHMSPVGTVLFIGLFAARYGFRIMTTGVDEVPGRFGAHSGQIMLYTDAGLVFLLALVSAQAWETWRRMRPLLAEHAANRAKAPE